MKDKPKRLLIQTGGHFSRPHEWCIVDFVYWKSNTRADHQWTCRLQTIQRSTPVKRIQTIIKMLDRLCKRGMGFSKSPFGKPQRRRCRKGLSAEAKQSYQYIFDARAFDAWLKSQPPLPPIRKRIDPYPKADSQLSENGQESYPETDNRIRNKKEEKKEIEEAVGSQPPSSTAVAPETEDLAEKFASFFKETTVDSASSGSPSAGSQPAEGGVPVGMPSTVAASVSPSTSIQLASGNSNADGTNTPDGALAPVSAPVIEGSGNGNTNTAAEQNPKGN